jgi:outer membrane protein assembly factor BamB
MKRLYSFLLFALSTFILSTELHAQEPPQVIWDGFYPDTYEAGNYTANDVKQAPFGGYVMVGSRRMTFEGNGYHEALVMRLTQTGYSYSYPNSFTKYYNNTPCDQELYDMIFTPGPQISYLATGYRDRTLLNTDTPPGLLLMEVWGNGSVLFDSVYYNNNQHHIMGRCIRPAIDGGYIITGSFAEDGGGTDQSFVTRMVKNEYGEYEFADSPLMQIIPAGESGYARWIQQFRGGYLLGGTAYNNESNRFDLFIQKLDVDRNLIWTKFYGGMGSDEFADAFVFGDTIYVAGTKGVTVPNASYFREQIYVEKLNADGATIWNNTYGGTSRYFANKMMMTGEGDLLVAGFYYDASMHAQMMLMKIDAETGDSLWTQDYGSFYNAGFRDVIRTDDYGYLTIGRASYTGSQDPRIYAMKLDHGGETEHLQVPRENLGVTITPGSTTSDAIAFTTEVDSIIGVKVMITSLLHPDVGDLEISLIHGGVEVLLMDRPAHGGENLDSTGFDDLAMYDIDGAYAPYKGWWKPEDRLGVFRATNPDGDWTLTIFDHGSGGTKATPVLDGWRLDFLVSSSGSGTGIEPEEALANFGLEQIWPNPVKQQASIRFRLPKPGHAKLVVYNQLGQIVGNVGDEHFAEGVHERIWNTGTLATGTYFIQLESSGMISVRKAMIIQ